MTLSKNFTTYAQLRHEVYESIKKMMRDNNV